MDTPNKENCALKGSKSDQIILKSHITKLQEYKVARAELFLQRR